MSFIINPYIHATGGGGGPVPSTLVDIWEWWEPWREVGLSDNDPMALLTGQKNGRDFVQATGASQPIYKTNQINGLAAARFAGASVFMDGPNPSALTAGHLFMVFKRDADPPPTSATSGLYSVGTNTDINHIPFTDGKIYDGAMSTVRKATNKNPDTALTGWVVYEVVSLSGRWDFRINGATSGNDFFTTATNTVGFGTNTQLGRSGSGYLVGYVAGFYLASAELTTDRATLIAYINTTFGLSSA